MWVGRGWRGAGWLLVVAVWGWGSASERSRFQSCLLDDTIFSFNPEKEKSCLMWGTALAQSGWLRAPRGCLGPGAPGASSRQPQGAQTWSKGRRRSRGSLGRQCLRAGVGRL